MFALWSLAAAIWRPSKRRDPAPWAAAHRKYPETAGIPGPRDPGQGETVGTTTSAGTPAALELQRFGHFNGAITRNGSALGNVVSADITYLGLSHFSPRQFGYGGRCFQAMSPMSGTARCMCAR